MRLKIKHLLLEPDGNEQSILTMVTGDDRIFIGGIHNNNWAWQEIPTPTPENTTYIGGQADSPFYRTK